MAVMLRRSLASLVLVASTLLACGGEDISPVEGTWRYLGSTLVTNTCGGDPPTDAAGTFLITSTGNSTFTVTTAFEEPFECSYNGSSFTCPNRQVGTITDPSFDATGFYQASVTGTLQSATEMSGTQTVNLSCEGPSCDLASNLLQLTFPCSYSYDFTAEAN